MIIPEDILQKQLCSQCGFYLSVGPIKVYPDRQVTCGKCSINNDLGVESLLYQNVIRNMVFPCKNRYDGCSALHSISNMSLHENQCHGGIYDCLLCSSFKGIAYDLNLHCQKNHPKEMLLNAEFVVDFSKSYHGEVFFYCQGVKLFFIFFSYDKCREKVVLDVIFIGKCYKGNMSYSFRLCSLERELLYKTKPVLCSVMEIRLESESTVKVDPSGIPRKLAVCQFFIHEESELKYIENIPVIDPSFDTCILKCSFKNIHIMNFDEAVVYPAVYYMKDMQWRVYIKRKLSLTDYKRKFGVFLLCVDDDPLCKVSATFSVLSSDDKTRISKSFLKREYQDGSDCHGLMLEDWAYVMDPISGFIEDNCINIEVKIKIYLDTNDPIQTCCYCNR